MPATEANLAAVSKYAAVVASGRSDAVDQINDVLVFPGIFGASSMPRPTW